MRALVPAPPKRHREWGYLKKSCVTRRCVPYGYACI